MGKPLRARCENDGAWIHAGGEWAWATIFDAMMPHAKQGHIVLVWRKGHKDEAKQILPDSRGRALVGDFAARPL